MAPTEKEKDIYVQIWAKAVDTQMHFNEMCVKSRQLGLTFVAAALGVGIVLLSRGGDFSLSQTWFGVSFQIHVSVLIVAAAALAMSGVRILDLNVYHKMLRGAVTFGEDFEENYMKQIFSLDKGMTQAISHFSRHQDAAVQLQGQRYQYTGSDRKNAEIKIRKFYKMTIWTLIGVTVALFIVTNLTQMSIPTQTIDREASEGAVAGSTPGGNGSDAQEKD